VRRGGELALVAFLAILSGCTTEQRSFRAAESARPLSAGRDLIHPELRNRLTEAQPGELIDVVVAVREEKPFRPLTPLVRWDSRYGPFNRDLLATRQREFDEELSERMVKMAPRAARISAQGGVIGEYYALCNCFVASATPKAIEELSEDAEVLALEPADLKGTLHLGETLSVARDRINSDPFFNAGYDGAAWELFVGVLDTGIAINPPSIHYNPTHIDFQRDCVWGGTNCEFTGDPRWNSYDNYGHGTSIAHVITGNAQAGVEHCGVGAPSGLVENHGWRGVPVRNRLRGSVAGPLRRAQGLRPSCLLR
jgi:hypothetical protein